MFERVPRERDRRPNTHEPRADTIHKDDFIAAKLYNSATLALYLRAIDALLQ